LRENASSERASDAYRSRRAHDQRADDRRLRTHHADILSQSSGRDKSLARGAGLRSRFAPTVVARTLDVVDTCTRECLVIILAQCSAMQDGFRALFLITLITSIAAIVAPSATTTTGDLQRDS
jgi:hypothetical protein